MWLSLLTIRAQVARSLQDQVLVFCGITCDLCVFFGFVFNFWFAIAVNGKQNRTHIITEHTSYDTYSLIFVLKVIITNEDVNVTT